MKILSKITFAFVCLSFIIVSSCSNDFEVTAAWKSLPVVYGFLNPKAETTYIRVEKAFIDEEISALEIAQNPDSLYYEDITVQISKGSNVYTLTRVDAAEEGFPRRSGIFATSPNYVYKIDTDDLDLRENQEYRLEIIADVDTILSAAQTTIVAAPEITTPDDDAIWTWTGDTEQRNPQRVRWRFNQTASIFDVRGVLHYRESTDGTPDNTTAKEISFVISRDLTPEDEEDTVMGITFFPNEFFMALASALAEEENNPGPRYFSSLDIVVDAAGSELTSYTKRFDANSGITGSNIPPTYTNLSRGFGIFSSRNYGAVTGISLNSSARDSLKNGRFTKDFNFQ